MPDGKLPFAPSFSFSVPNFSIIQARYPADYVTLPALDNAISGLLCLAATIGCCLLRVTLAGVSFLSGQAASNISSPSVRFMGSKIGWNLKIISSDNTGKIIS